MKGIVPSASITSVNRNNLLLHHTKIYDEYTAFMEHMLLQHCACFTEEKLHGIGVNSLGILSACVKCKNIIYCVDP